MPSASRYIRSLPSNPLNNAPKADCACSIGTSRRANAASRRTIGEGSALAFKVRSHTL